MNTDKTTTDLADIINQYCIQTTTDDGTTTMLAIDGNTFVDGVIITGSTLMYIPTLVLKNLVFRDCIFYGVVFENIKLDNVWFYGCTFAKKCKFNSSLIHGCTFKNCLISQTRFNNTRIQQSTMLSCEFIRNVIFNDGTSIIDSYIEGSEFKEATFFGVAFDKTYLRLCKFNECNMNWCDFGKMHNSSPANEWIECRFTQTRAGNGGDIISFKLEPYTTITMVKGVVSVGCTTMTIDEWREIADNEYHIYHPVNKYYAARYGAVIMALYVAHFEYDDTIIV